MGDGRVGGGRGFVEPVVLTGEQWVTLEPLRREHISEVAAVAADGELGRLWFTAAPAPQAVEQWVYARLAVQAPDTGLTFVVRRRDGTLVGSSSYMSVDAANRRLEIGNTWYVASARRSGVNTETKLLMLGHAFDELGCIAVEFRTHFFNMASRAAIERLGAKLDGILRSHQVLPDGSRRDTVVYSILDVEWPAVRNNLLYRLSRHA
ncbi:GCN5 family acetyltransferase [Mycobacterium sp. IS-1590]|uniref:GNAT family N-acetyltransferase n=1 Tax=Mycobacterium sp. IS-1590 TaxID=1772286 RepID=UPI000746FEC6|nr:GNAT family N-acetyltransferase [Mycobacterium sp. IS-1590]KUI41566.1 GCN5 family acetyltransferase [Mycobacterium sp. IS-1590]